MSPPPGLVKSYSLITTSVIIVAVVFAVLASAAVALRFYARRTKSLRIGADDWTILFSLLMVWFCSLNTFITGGISGIDTTTMEPFAAAELFLRCVWLDGFPLGIGLATIKISILLFYRRIFVTKAFRRCVDVFIYVLIAWGISTVLAHLFCANPISGVWDPTKSLLRYNYPAFALAVACMSLVFDFMVLCFPLPVIRTLHMPTRRKVSVAGIFWLGAFCCIAASLRLYYIFQGNHLVAHSTDVNRYASATNEFLWVHIEPSCSILAACLPTYGPLLTSNTASDKFVSGWGCFVSICRYLTRFPLRRPSGSGGRKINGNRDGDRGSAVDAKPGGNFQMLNVMGVYDSDSADFARETLVKVTDLEAQEERWAQ